eukprot:c14253_g2_i1.p1 GENE.c14253_g2_i1~~c14253_g2_i1.p1  ORF type:complete len:247 (-),score=56.23 c14253_g2_i1:406-1146(-)
MKWNEMEWNEMKIGQTRVNVQSNEIFFFFAQGEHEAMRKIKNEFMGMWDGLRTKQTERVLVMGATNRPFDLDDAVLRRMPRRLLVDLPNDEQRVKILKVILEKEVLAPEFDFVKVSEMTKGFSGSDLKSLCTAAAFIPIREFLAKEPSKASAKSAEEPMVTASDGDTTWGGDGYDWGEVSQRFDAPDSGAPGEGEVGLRPLMVCDFEQARKEVTASVSDDSPAVQEIRKWAEQMNDPSQPVLSYFI